MVQSLSGVTPQCKSRADLLRSDWSTAFILVWSLPSSVPFVAQKEQSVLRYECVADPTTPDTRDVVWSRRPKGRDVEERTEPAGGAPATRAREAEESR